MLAPSTGQSGFELQLCTICYPLNRCYQASAAKQIDKPHRQPAMSSIRPPPGGAFPPTHLAACFNSKSKGQKGNLKTKGTKATAQTSCAGMRRARAPCVSCLCLLHAVAGSICGCCGPATSGPKDVCVPLEAPEPRQRPRICVFSNKVRRVFGGRRMYLQRAPKQAANGWGCLAPSAGSPSIYNRCRRQRVACMRQLPAAAVATAPAARHRTTPHYTAPAPVPYTCSDFRLRYLRYWEPPPLAYSTAPSNLLALPLEASLP